LGAEWTLLGASIVEQRAGTSGQAKRRVGAMWRQAVLLPGLVVALVLLGVGELAPKAFPVRVSIAVTGQDVDVQMDGGEKTFHLPSGRPYASIRFVEPGPVNREFQIDGSDTVVRDDRDAAAIQGMQGSLLYRFDAWLRDEGSYSRWGDVRLIDADSGRILAQGVDEVQQVSLPSNFVLEAGLQRPEAAAQIWLVTGGKTPVLNSVLEINRPGRFARWLVGDGKDETARWFFPEQPAPFGAGVLELIGRAAIAGYALFAGVLGLSWALQRLPIRGRMPTIGHRTTGLLVVLACAGWLGAASWVTIQLYHQLPHLLDAATFAFQARLAQTGRFWLEAPPLGQLFTTDLQTIRDGRWIGQYPPGAPVLLGIGGVVGLAWLVGPLCALAGIVATAIAARYLYDESTGLVTLVLGLISPFILFLSGAFMSEPIAGALLAGALAAFAYARQRKRDVWYAVAGALLGLGFVTREFGTLLFAAPLGAWLVFEKRWRGLALLVAAGLPLLVVYLAYNAAVTGDPLLLPRNVVDPNDRVGFGTFGDRHHTLAAGLIYTDMNLTLLQFDLFGWPPLFALGLPMLPFLLGAARRVDWWLACGVVCCIAGYVLVPGHGAQLGPRYYYGALPYLVPLAACGLLSMVSTARRLGLPRAAASLSVLVVGGLLTLNTFAYYLPHSIARRTDYLGMVGRPGLALPFVQTTLHGPQLVGFNGPTLVLVLDSELYKTLSALNCPLLDPEHIQSCPVLFANAGRDRAAELSQAYPGRTVLVATLGDHGVTLTPL
jgi:4-amino-4-deoxy-L-arabinose transferase-like glycosyltransferase